MGINERANKNQTAQNTPQPKCACVEIVRNTSACQLVTNSIGNLVIPNKWNDAESQACKDKHDQTIVHCLFTIVSTCNRVNVGANSRHNNQTVNTKSNYRQKDELQKASICFQLSNRGRTNSRLVVYTTTTVQTNICFLADFLTAFRTILHDFSLH